jgi:hypothetical protein|tara:strand:- start:19200 stop:19502 length:303 start_codon:yes stop_codon:yes gene_type:complete
MNLIDMFIFISASVGITSGLVMSSLLLRFREFVSAKSDLLSELIHCPMCTGFWVGMTTSCFFDINPIWGAFIISIFSWVVIQVVDSIISVGEYYSLDDGE